MTEPIRRKSYLGVTIACLAVIPVGVAVHWHWCWRATIAAIVGGALGGIVDVWRENP